MRTLYQSGIRSTAGLLVFLLIVPSLPAQTIPSVLNLVVVEGEGAVNNIRRRVAREPIVRVEDENHRPIAGAAVVFTLPTEGATGEFGNGSKTLTVMSDSRGEAKAEGLRMNGLPGKVPIHVTASYRGLSAREMITQSSVVPPGEKPSQESSGHGHGSLIAVIAVIGAAAAGGGAYFALHGKSSSSSNTPSTPTTPTAIGITPGTGTIVGAH